jgi:hypothetical protein
MDNYTPTLEDIKFAKQVFDTVIMTQTLNPHVVKQAFRRLFGYEPMNAQQAKIKLFAYFQHQFKGFDKTETALPETSTSLSTETGTQTHTEDNVETKPKRNVRKSTSKTKKRKTS